jgi:hypothetical protein
MAFITPTCLTCWVTSADIELTTRKPESSRASGAEDVAEEVAAGLRDIHPVGLDAAGREHVVPDARRDPARLLPREIGTIHRDDQLVESLRLIEHADLLHRDETALPVREHRRERVDVVREARDAQDLQLAVAGIDRDEVALLERHLLLCRTLQNDLTRSWRPRDAGVREDALHLRVVPSFRRDEVDRPRSFGHRDAGRRLGHAAKVAGAVTELD